MGLVLSSSINIYLIWYGRWAASHQLLIKDFLLSISTSDRCAIPSPSVSQWWRTVSLYTDQTNANISSSVLVAGEYSDPAAPKAPTSPCSRSSLLTSPIKTLPCRPQERHLPHPHLWGRHCPRLLSGRLRLPLLHLLVRGGYMMPYAWAGNSGKQCPEVCAYPFAVPRYIGGGRSGALAPPNTDDKRDRARAGRASIEPTGERVVCGGGPHGTDGDRGPVREAVRDRGRGRVHWAGDEGQRGKDVQREGEERSGVRSFWCSGSGVLF
ncbi:unnamed protein product [Coffea canephora]|uniref:Uncharacterized protein n=1 Tax=Coffea canephora TaxID=49390 RepID=A0A068U1C6_COFCA|nr:unnamed protein product [Coffea canephora]